MPEEHGQRDLIVAILQLSNLFTRRLAAIFENASITPQQWTILTALSKSGPTTLAGLARAMIVSKQNMTGMISRLETTGYIVRNEDPSDLRSTRVVLTPRGRRQVEKLRPQYEAWREELMQEIGERDLEVVQRAVERLIAKLS